MRVNEDQKISKGSLKSMDLLCDYCGEEFSIIQRTYFKSRIITPKDACSKCRTKKRKESCLKKYGTEIASQSREVKKNSKKGKVVEDYRDEIISLYNEGISVSQISARLDITTSVLFSYLHRLGLDTRGDIQEKMKRTNIERYGKPYFLQTEEGQNKLKASFLEKYGSENPFDNEEYKKRYLADSAKTNMERYGVKRMVQHPDRQEEFNKKRRITRIKNNNEVEYDGKTARELAADIGINLSSFHERVRKIGLEKAVSTEKHQTYLESMMGNLLEELGVEFKTQFYIDGKIADFLIPSHNIIIETDGLYWHSDAIQPDNSYHTKKRSLYLEHGYKPLFFYEDEVNNSFGVVKSIIGNKLGFAERVFARKTTAVIGGADKEFFAANHLMGKGRGHIFSLLYDGEPICSMQVSRTRNDEYDISRFCCKQGFSVVGGFSKLLTLAEHTLDMSSLRTFIDLRYGEGDYLEKFGFQRGAASPSFQWTDGRSRFHRLQFRGSTGYKSGLARIWDCGQLPFLKTY